VLAAEQEPVDVALAEPDHPGIVATRPFCRNRAGCLCLCRHDFPKFFPQ